MPVCEGSGPPPQGTASLAKLDGNVIVDHAVPAKLKHFSAQVAMVRQSSALSHGLALCGQQSPSIAAMSAVSLEDVSVVDMSAEANDLKPAPAVTGSIATDRATSRVRIVRPTRIDRAYGTWFAEFSLVSQQNTQAA